jgi:hypothetical protein
MKPSNFSIEEQIRAAARVTEPRREFSDTLWGQLAAAPQPPASRFSWLQRLFTRRVWAAAVALALMALVVVLLSTPGVAAAFSQLIGYLPGIGFVENSSDTLYLAAPVSTEQQGITLTVEQTVADENGMVIAYHLDGFPAGDYACFYDQNQVLLPGGKTLYPIGGGGQGHQMRIEYPPLPDDVKQVTLLASMMQPDPACSAPAAWKIGLSLDPLPAQATLMPVYQGGEIQPQTAGAVETPKTAPGSQIRFTVDRMAELEDGYMIAVHIDWEDETWENVYPDYESLEVIDADGKSVPVDLSQAEGKDHEITFKTIGKTYRGPFTLKIPAVSVFVYLEEGPAFSFDAGAAPHTGQRWQIDQALELFEHEIYIKAVQAIESEKQIDPPQEAARGYAIELQAAPEIQNLDLVYSGNQTVNQSWGQNRPGPGENMRLEIFYPGGLPSGNVTFRVWSIQFRLDGSWQAQWQLPAASE